VEEGVGGAIRPEHLWDGVGLGNVPVSLLSGSPTGTMGIHRLQMRDPSVMSQSQGDTCKPMADGVLGSRRTDATALS
jgi:hypothetical protein